MIDQNNHVRHSILIIVGFIIALFGSLQSLSLLGISIENPVYKSIFFNAWWLLPVVLVTGLLYGFRNIFKELRLHKGFLMGFLLGVLVVLPMFLGSAYLGTMNDELSFTEILIYKALVPGTLEEILFRGFLFGLLFRKAKWGFIPAALLGAVIFGLGHIYQSGSIAETIGIFAITFMGGIWYSWLFIEWKENLWVLIWIHILMNFSWVLFDVSESGALGGASANVFRSATILFFIIATIAFNMKKDRFRITLKNLFIINTAEKNKLV